MITSARATRSAWSDAKCACCAGSESPTRTLNGAKLSRMGARMAKDKTTPAANTAASGRWRMRITRSLAAAGLKDRGQLIEVLSDAQQRGVLDADAFAMLEGALAVADLQVRNIMIPRVQMVC